MTPLQIITIILATIIIIFRGQNHIISGKVTKEQRETLENGFRQFLVQ